MFTSTSQIVTTLFGINIYYYGVIMAFAIILGTLVAEMISTKYYLLKKDIIFDLAPYLIIFGIIGARLYYCILNYDFYLRFPTEIIALRHGGISIHGAIIGGLIGLYIFSLKYKISFAKLADISAIGLVIGQAVGRWGNFFNSEAFGLPTDLPFKLYVAPQYRPIPYENYEYFHPTFLYESVADFLIFLTLLCFLKYFKVKRVGNIALIYLLLYSIARIIIEFIRIDSVAYIFGVPVPIVISVLIIIISIILLIWNNIYIKRKVL